MRTDGKQLEELVAFIEKTLLPHGFEVATNDLIYEDGAQIAEFDIVVRGKIGSTNIAWLIECRDRPGEGRAPGSWIEQLVSRRNRFKFNKVTAVSTTGFAAGAAKYAQEQGIEIREVRALCAEDFTDWLEIQHLCQRNCEAKLHAAQLLFNEGERGDRRAAISRLISAQAGDANFLRSTKSGERISAQAALYACVFENGDFFEGLEPNAPGRRIRLHAEYVNPDDHYVVDTDLGIVRVEAIVFSCELSIRETVIPVTFTGEYVAAEDGAPFSQLATFEPNVMQEGGFSLEMHRLAETGETHVIVRSVQAGAARWSLSSSTGVPPHRTPGE